MILKDVINAFELNLDLKELNELELSSDFINGELLKETDDDGESYFEITVSDGSIEYSLVISPNSYDGCVVAILYGPKGEHKMGQGYGYDGLVCYF